MNGDLRRAENYEKQTKSKGNLKGKKKQIFKTNKQKTNKIYATTMRIHKLQLKQPYTHSHIQE